MTHEEIKAYIIEQVEELEKNGKNTNYIAGQVVGMVKAFVKIGMLEHGHTFLAEIMKEI